MPTQNRESPAFEAPLAEGVGLEPTSPCGQRFSSVWPDVLAGPAYLYLMLFDQVSDKTTS
jgi:hypothetical protein